MPELRRSHGVVDIERRGTALGVCLDVLGGGGTPDAALLGRGRAAVVKVEPICNVETALGMDTMEARDYVLKAYEHAVETATLLHAALEDLAGEVGECTIPSAEHPRLFEAWLRTASLLKT